MRLLHRHRWHFVVTGGLAAGYCPCGAWGRQWYDFLSGGVDRVHDASPPDDLRAVQAKLEGSDE